MEPTTREQRLVDLCFSIALMLSDTNGRDREGKKLTLYKWPQEKKAAWIAEQLRACGFPTQPCGASHGVLVSDVDTSDKVSVTTRNGCSSFWERQLVLKYAQLYEIGGIVSTAPLTPNTTAYRYISKLIRESTGSASNKRLAAEPKVYVDKSGYMTIWYMDRIVLKLDMLDHLLLFRSYCNLIKSYAVSRATSQQLLQIHNMMPLREILVNIEKEKHETSKAV